MKSSPRIRFNSLTNTIAATVVIAFAASLLAIWALRLMEIDRAKEQLTDALHTQIHIIESLTVGNRARPGSPPEVDTEAMLDRIIEAYRNNQGIGKTSEIVLGRRTGDEITFLLEHRHDDGGIPDPIPFSRAASEGAEPMRRALRGERGTVIADDYRGVSVIAAYSEIPSLELGIVAKIDLAEIENPYVWALFLTVFSLIAVGVLAIFRTTKGLARKLEKSERENVAYLTRIEDQQRALDVHAIVSVADENGVIKYANDHFCQLSEYDRDEIIGNTYSIMHSGHHDAAFYQTIWDTIWAGEPWRGEIENRSKSGRYYWVDTSIVPFRGADGAIEQFIAVQTDITDAKRQEHDLVLARERAEEANRAKSMFLANMSHEIRTPMNAVLGFSELLIESGLEGERLEFLRAIQNSGNILIDVINEILDVTKIESGEEKVCLGEVNLIETVNQICDVFSAQATEKGITLERGFHRSARCLIKTDEVKLKKILTNLIGNAVKFTHEGSVSVKVSIENLTPSEHRLRINVKDTGIGIDQTNLQRVFRKFTQADSSHSRQYGGTGLGLSICKGLVSLLGGDISVKSEPGSGSIFKIDIPVERIAFKAPERTLDSALPETKRFDAKALIAEDNEANQFLVLTMLEALGLHCEIVEDGSEAVECVARNAYDVVFMDIHMPVMDGFEATRRIREEEARRGGEGVIIIAITAKAMKGDRERCMEAQMDDYIPKPFSKEALRFMLAKHLSVETDRLS